ncbi:MAG: CRISPR-associated protein Cas4 [Thermodesulfovibrionales bacterium]
MFTEDELLPISALQHLAFCERQWGLIHLEGLWDENRLTVEGRHLHGRADEAEAEVRGDIRVVRGLRLRSLRLGLSGKADVVEFYSGGRVAPVEYKRGRPKIEPCDEFQLCAQALCLEEMLDVQIVKGMLFYGVPRRRYTVTFDSPLRLKTEGLCSRLHALTKEGKTPRAKYGKKCRSCSLLESCLPKACGGKSGVEQYLKSALEETARL